MSTQSQSPWQSNHFLLRLQTAARGGYIPRTRRPKGLRHPPGTVVGQLAQPGIGIDDLLVDLVAEKHVLVDRHGRSDRALGYLHRALGHNPRRLKPATVGRIGGALAKHSEKIIGLRRELADASRRISLVASLRDTLILASLPGWENFGGGLRVGDNGKICGEKIDPPVESPFPMDHPVIQAGLHAALILAGDDRAEFTGIRGDVLPFANSAGGGRMPSPSGEGLILGTVTDDILKRIAALVRALSETVVHTDLSLGTVELAQTRLNVVSKMLNIVRDIFWGLAAEIHPDLAGKQLELKPDWTIVEKAKPGILANLLSELFGSVGGASDGGGLAEMLAQAERLSHRPPFEFDRRNPLHEEPFNCGNPNCPIHGKRNGNGRHPARRTRAPAGAGA